MKELNMELPLTYVIAHKRLKRKPSDKLMDKSHVILGEFSDIIHLEDASLIYFKSNFGCN
jgi:hypothetical protein